MYLDLLNLCYKLSSKIILRLINSKDEVIKQKLSWEVMSDATTRTEIRVNIYVYNKTVGICIKCE